MMEFASVTTGLPVSYIELTNVAVSIVLNESANVFCALFHDRADGPSFGRLICSEVLSCFVEEYQQDIGSLVSKNLKDFQSFHHRIAEVFQSSIKPVLVGLQAQRGVQKALLVTEDSIISPSSDVDQLGILANLQAFLGYATDLMGEKEDSLASSVSVTEFIIEGPANSRIFLKRIETSLLVVVLAANADTVKLGKVLSDSIHTLQHVCNLNDNLHLVAR